MLKQAVRRSLVCDKFNRGCNLICHECNLDLNKQPNAQIDDQTYQFTTVQPLENTDVDLPQATGSSNEEEILGAIAH